MENSAKLTIEELDLNSKWRLGIYDIIYDREGSICLNGLWSSNNKRTMNEIARKQGGKEGIVGTYKVSWIQNVAPFCICGTLEIEEKKSIYTFKWTKDDDNNEPSYIGRGIQMNNQLIVFYLEQN